ncbi:hypothetical protein [Maridesulfovibrio sp.]|uniref:NACHT domain-containing protein n=1 Tax=unclassified Maridesulfovibrio TaxID=2794999 RepID=UPI003AFF614A
MRWPISNDIDETYSNIKYDINCFANRNTLNQIKAKNNKLTLEWKDKRITKNATFTITRDHQIKVNFNDSIFTYRDFLASPAMADLEYTSSQIVANMQTMPLHLTTEANRIPDSNKETERIEFKQLIKQILATPLVSKNELINATQVIFIRGQAGAGKSIAVKDITRSQAMLYQQAKSDFLYFYIDAQGRALARIEEAIALETQRYNLQFRYDALSALTRNTLIIPIIDGFDELIGSGGFADAFKSLSSFLMSLKENGCIIATGRSTFYDAKMLSYIANNYNSVDPLNYQFETIEICDWTEEQRRQYFKKVEERDGTIFTDAAEQQFRLIPPHNSLLLSKPFFCAQLADFFSHKQTSNNQNTSAILNEVNLVESLLNFYIERENNKMLNRQGVPILTIQNHKSFLNELAIELWWQEQRTIDQETLQTVAEIVTEDQKISPEDAAIFTNKVTSHALLSSEFVGDEQLLKFESQAYYDYFLLNSLNQLIFAENNRDLKLFFSRSLLGENFIQYFEHENSQQSPAKAKKTIEILCCVSSKSPVGSLARRNIGSLICSILRQRSDLNNITIKEIECYRESINGFSTNASVFLNCTFRDLYAHGVKLTNSQFKNCTFSNMHISNSSIFNGSDIIPTNTLSSLHFESNKYNSLKEIHSIFTQLGANNHDTSHLIEFNQRQKEVIDLIEKFYKKTMNKLFFDLDKATDPQFNPIINNPNWSELREIFLKYEILTTTKRSRAGTINSLYRFNVSTDNILEYISNKNTCPNRKMSEFHDWFHALH